MSNNIFNSVKEIKQFKLLSNDRRYAIMRKFKPDEQAKSQMRHKPYKCDMGGIKNE